MMEVYAASAAFVHADMFSGQVKGDGASNPVPEQNVRVRSLIAFECMKASIDPGISLSTVSLVLGQYERVRCKQ